MSKRPGITYKNPEQGIGNPMLPRLLPLREAASYLGLSLWAVRERIWSGQLPVVQFPSGRKQYIDREDLDKFIEKNKRRIE
nr:hypothetical protein 7 [Desulfobacterales bacterium]